jgi:hypothetical protein
LVFIETAMLGAVTVQSWLLQMPEFATLVHADWSVSPRKRWVAVARHHDAGWLVDCVRLVGPIGGFREFLTACTAHGSVLAGFDFPIGVPDAYGAQTGAESFPGFLSTLGDERWADFGRIAASPEDIRIERPFYPASSTAGVRQASLLAAHGANSFDDLRRTCERATERRRAACPVFWTLGGNQVGRGALSGWAEVVRPMIEQGARLWPFEGSLSELAARGGVVLAETYPGEAYGHVGVVFKATESKRRQGNRVTKAAAILGWAAQRGVTIAPAVEADITDGFGAQSNGEDRFDALLGLLGMIEVVADWRPEAVYPPGAPSSWEGWILGQ